MKLSAPIYHLKRQARLLARQGAIPLHEALDAIAVKEGFAKWSHLTARFAVVTTAGRLFARLTPGNLVLIGARPGQGKTLLGLNVALEAIRAGNRGLFFTLETTERQCLDRLFELGATSSELSDRFEADCSDDICADVIMRRLQGFAAGTVAVIDYLQLLDQRRETPPLAEQVVALKRFARDNRVIIVCISQISRSYDPAKKACPDLGDVRLANPIDLRQFDQSCFLHDGKVRFSAVT